MFVWRLCLVVLVAALAEAAQVNQQQPSSEVKATTYDQDVIRDEKLWTPEVTVHLLSLVETIHTKLVSWEAQASTAQRGLEEKVDHLQVQLMSKINDAESMVAAVEQRLQSQLQASETRFSTSVTSVTDKLSQLEDRLELKTAHVEEMFKDNSENVEQRLKSEIRATETMISGAVSSLTEKMSGLESKIVNLEGIFKDRMKENCPSRSDVGMLGLTYELNQFGKLFIDDVEEKLKKVTNKIDIDRNLTMGYFRNVTNKLQEGVNREVDFLVKAGRDISQNFNRSSVDFLESFKNVTDRLEEGIYQATDSIAQTSWELYENVSDNLSNLQEELVNERKHYLEEFKSMTDVLAEKVKVATNPLVFINKTMTSSVAKQEALLDRFSEQVDHKISDFNNQLFQGVDGRLGMLNDSLNTYMKEQSNALQEYGSKIDELYEISERSVQTLENCRKGMKRRPASEGMPYSLVYFGEKPLLCDTETQSGGWIVIQYRAKGDTDFYRGWEDYKNGFGTLDTDFWVGLETIHDLTTSATYELRVDLKHAGESKFAHYSTFSVGSESENYKLTLGSYDGTAGDSLSYHNGAQFSTKKRDNDQSSSNCAKAFQGGWWYKACHYANLNGIWGDHSSKGTNWHKLTGHEYPVSMSAMKIRRVQ